MMGVTKKRRMTRWNPKAKGQGGQDEEQGWLTSYGDMMTLLLVFFVLLFAISSIDPVKMQQVTQRMREAIGGEAEVQHVPTLKEIEEDLEDSIYELGVDQLVSVNRDREGVQLILRGESFFESGRAQLRPETFEFLDEIAWQIQKNPYRVSVEGHTDNIPIRTQRFPSNWELSAARAAAVVRYFEEKEIPRRRFRVVGWADVKPANPAEGNLTAAARAKNRRVVVVFMNEFAAKTADSDFVSTEDVLEAQGD
jgi:chemotaxis protein MotB